jgi:hypothetical protein
VAPLIPLLEIRLQPEQAGAKDWSSYRKDGE